MEPPSSISDAQVNGRCDGGNVNCKTRSCGGKKKKKLWRGRTEDKKDDASYRSGRCRSAELSSVGATSLVLKFCPCGYRCGRTVDADYGNNVTAAAPADIVCLLGSCRSCLRDFADPSRRTSISLAADWLEKGPN